MNLGSLPTMGTQTMEAPQFDTPPVDVQTKPTRTRKAKPTCPALLDLPNEKVANEEQAKALAETIDMDAHRSCKKTDFNTDALFHYHRAHILQRKAALELKTYEDCKKFGGSIRGNAARLAKQQDEIDQLRKMLEAQGIDVEQALAGVSG